MGGEGTASEEDRTKSAEDVPDEIDCNSCKTQMLVVCIAVKLSMMVSLLVQK